MKPRIPLLDKRFVWVPASATNIRERFDAERKRIGAQRHATATDTQAIVNIFDRRRERK
jgi:hypothetical protein